MRDELNTCINNICIYCSKKVSSYYDDIQCFLVFSIWIHFISVFSLPFSIVEARRILNMRWKMVRRKWRTKNIERKWNQIASNVTHFKVMHEHKTRQVCFCQQFFFHSYRVAFTQSHIRTTRTQPNSVRWMYVNKQMSAFNFNRICHIYRWDRWDVEESIHLLTRCRKRLGAKLVRGLRWKYQTFFYILPICICISVKHLWILSKNEFPKAFPWKSISSIHLYTWTHFERKAIDWKCVLLQDGGRTGREKDGEKTLKSVGGDVSVNTCDMCIIGMFFFLHARSSKFSQTAFCMRQFSILVNGAFHWKLPIFRILHLN